MSDTNLEVKITAKFDELKAGLDAASREIDSMGSRIDSSLSGSAASVNKLGSSINGLVPQILGVAAAFETVRVAGQQFAAGIQFNSVMEQAQLGIATLITAESQLRDANGKTLTGQDALSAAIGLSADQMQKLRIAGLQTSATTQQLSEAFQQAVGAGLSAGLTLDQVRTVTIGITQAAGALGVPMNQLNQEVTSILAGQIDMNSRVAKALGLSNQMVASWKQQGTLAEELNNRMSAFAVAGAETAKTWEATKSNIVEARDTLMGIVTSGFFDQMKTAANEALSGIFDVNNATIGKDLKGFSEFAKRIFDELGADLASAIRGGVSALKDMSAWLEENRALIVSMDAAFSAIWGVVKSIAAELKSWAGSLIDALGGANTLRDIFNGIAFSVASMRDFVKDVKSLGVLGASQQFFSGAQGQNVQALQNRLNAPDQSPMAAPTTGRAVGVTIQGNKVTDPNAQKAAEKAATAHAAQVEKDIADAERAMRKEVEIEARGIKLKSDMEAQAIAHKEAMLLEEVKAAEETSAFEVRAGRKTHADALKDEMAFERQKYKIKLDALKNMDRLEKDDKKKHQKNLQEQEKLEKKHQAAMLAMHRKAALEQAHVFDGVFSSIKNAFSSSIQGMIMGIQTFQQAMANMAMSVLGSFIDMCVQMAMEWAANQIAKMIIGESSNQSIAESDAALAAVAAAGSVAAIPVIGWALAPTVAAATYASLQPYVGMTSAEGGFDIPAGVNPITQLHQREMVLPAEHADTIRGLSASGGARNGGTTVNLNVSAVDGHSVKRFFESHSHLIAGAVAKQARNGNMQLRRAMA